jgi:hypothetical protein
VILADTSIWIDHLRANEGQLTPLLEVNLVCVHAFVIGELSCGSLSHREEFLGALKNLPRLAAATEDEALYFIEHHRLMGRGIGYIDAHLLAATALHSTKILTRDKRLLTLAEELGLAWKACAH